MKSNKMGIHVGRNIDNFLNMLFGRTTKFEQTESKLPNGVSFEENVGLDNQARKTSLEAQLNESQVFELIRRSQNR
jgi:L-2-hydroxyglutarate oxidase LhgO